MRRIVLHRPITRTLAALRGVYRRTALRNAKAPAGYSVAGTPVEVHLTGHTLHAVIEKQAFGGPGAMFRVRLKKPVPFKAFSAFMGIPTASASGREKLFEEYQRLGCLERVIREEGGLEAFVVTCMWAPWRFLTIPLNRLKKGQPVEVVVESAKHVQSIENYPVRFVKWMKRKHDGRHVPLVWFPEPVTYFDIAKIYLWNFVRPEHISKHAYLVTLDMYRKLYDAGLKLPRARRRRMGGMKMMEFLEPVPIKTFVDRFMRPYYKIKQKEDPGLRAVHIWGSLLITVLFHMAPLDPRRIDAIRPMREDLFYGLVIPAEAAFEGIA